MLYITYKEPENLIHDVDDFFNYNYEDAWFEDPIVKQMVLDIDKTEVISANCAVSPILGSIPITKISGGVKALILMYKRPDLVIWATACGDNCAEWIIRLSEKQDVRIMLEHTMLFPRDFEAICIDNNRHITNIHEYIANSFACLFD